MTLSTVADFQSDRNILAHLCKGGVSQVFEAAGQIWLHHSLGCLFAWGVLSWLYSDRILQRRKKNTVPLYYEF